MEFAVTRDEKKVDFTLDIDDEGDLVLMANGIEILGLDSRNGRLISYTEDNGCFKKLRSAGFVFEENESGDAILSGSKTFAVDYASK